MALEKPRSAIASAQRQRIKRAGVSDVEARAAVKSAWEDAASAASLRDALASSGLRIVPGAKAGVHLVATADGVEIGALDRIVRARRVDVRQFMEKADDVAKPCSGRPGNSHADENDRHEYGKAFAPLGTVGTDRWAKSAGATEGNVDRNPISRPPEFPTREE
jgi:hypothetical protein